VQVALDAPALGRAGVEQAPPRVAQLALEVSGPHGDERGLRGRRQQLRMVAERLAGRHRRDRPAVVLDEREAAPVVGRRALERRAVRLAEHVPGRVPVPEPQRRIVEGRGDGPAPARRRREPGELEQQASQRAAREQLGLDQRGREAEAEHDRGGGEHPAQRGHRRVRHREQRAEAHEHERGEERERRRRHRDQFATLGPAGRPQAPHERRGEPGGGDQRERERDAHGGVGHAGRVRDLERVRRARGIARDERPGPAGQAAGQQRARDRPQQRRQRERADERSLVRPLQAPGRERDAHVHQEAEVHALAHDAEGEEGRAIRGLDRERQSGEAERGEERAVRPGRAAPPPDEPDEHGSRHQVRPVHGDEPRVGEVLARHRELDGERDDDRQRESGREPRRHPSRPGREGAPGARQRDGLGSGPRVR